MQWTKEPENPGSRLITTDCQKAFRDFRVAGKLAITKKQFSPFARGTIILDPLLQSLWRSITVCI